MSLKSTYGDMRRKELDAWAGDMVNHVDPRLAHHLRRHVDQLPHPNLLSRATGCAEQGHRRGVIVPGDAAHTLSPEGTQHVNLVLSDALVAAKKVHLGRRQNRLHAIRAHRQTVPMAEIRALQELQAQTSR